MKLTNLDWWMNRTPEQLERRARLERRLAWMDSGPAVGKRIQQLGVSAMLYVTLPLLVLVLLFPLGIVLAPLVALLVYRIRNRKGAP